VTEKPGQAPTITRLGRYRLVRQISAGGMARVYEARRESLAGVAPKVAIKVIRPEHATDETFQRLFVTEAHIGAALQHQNLVQIQDFDRQGDCFYLVMEYVEGHTFRKLISLSRHAGVAVPLSVIGELGRQACDGLHYFHTATTEDGRALQMVHRDMKPSNLVLMPSGTVKVLDFGISKALIAAERKGSVKGTWGYMAPEQAAGLEVHGAADQFGLASVLYELAAHRPLFPEKDPGVIRGLLEADQAAARAATLAGGHWKLGRVLVRALQRDPAARFPSAHAMGEALHRLVEDPVRNRERVKGFVASLTPTSRSAPPVRPSAGSQDTMSRVRQEPQMAAAAAPVPDVHIPRSALRRDEGGGTWKVFALGALALVVAFTAFRWATATDTVEAEPPAEPAAAVAPVEAVHPLRPEPEAAATAEVAPEPDPAPAAPDATPAPERPPAPSAPEVQRPVRTVPAPPVAERVPEPEPDVDFEPRLGGGSGETVEAVQEVGPNDDAPSVEDVATDGASGLLTVSSLPRSKVVVDGQFVRYTPLFQHGLPAGEHTVLLELDDGRRHRFMVDVPEDGEVRRIWHFDQATWVER